MRRMHTASDIQSEAASGLVEPVHHDVVPVQSNSWEIAARGKFGAFFSLKFAKKKEFKLFYKTMLERGVYLAPSEYKANFLSFAHTKKDVKDTIKAADAAFRRII